jgi:hypothetical protein
MTGMDVAYSTLVFPPTGPAHWGHVHELGHNEQVRGYLMACVRTGWLAGTHGQPLGAPIHTLTSARPPCTGAEPAPLLLHPDLQLPEWTWSGTGEVTCNFFSARAQAVVRNNTDPRNFYGCAAATNGPFC